MPGCPAGHRLLVQILHTNDVQESREYLVRTFGPVKGKAAILKPGTLRPTNQYKLHGQWVHSDEGYRAFLKA